MSINTTTKHSRIKLHIACMAFAVAVAASGALAVTAPKVALANDGSYSETRGQDHYEGENVTIWPEGNSVYAEWHRGDSGQWWATFWTYNGTKVYAQEAPAGSGWTFHCYDNNGRWTQIIRYDTESTTEGQVGPKGIASHWRELNGNRWF